MGKAKQETKSSRWAFVISAGNPHYPNVGGPSHGDQDAIEFAKSLNIPSQQKIISIGHDATCAVLQSHWKRLLKQARKDDELFVYFAARQFHSGKDIYLSAWDTLAHDPDTTAINLTDWFNAIGKSKLKQVYFFLDIAQSDIKIETDHLDLKVSNTQKTGQNRPSIFGFVSTSESEPTYQFGSPPRGIWASLLIDAFSGRTLSALTQENVLTADTLEKYINAELPRKLRQIHGPSVQQNPYRFGSLEDAQLATFDRDNGFVTSEEFQKIIFRGETRSKIRELAGYRKSFQLPDRASASSNKFFARIASEEIKQELEETYQSIIHHFGYKRKEVSLTLDRDGIGIIRTPDFEYTLYVELDSDDPTVIAWKREISHLMDFEIVRTPAFAETFQPVIDRLIFGFEPSRNISEFIDRFEDQPIKGCRLTAGPNSDWCELQMPGFAGVIRFEPQQMIAKSRAGDFQELLKVMSICIQLTRF
jgi:hypothetical protein